MKLCRATRLFFHFSYQTVLSFNHHEFFIFVFQQSARSRDDLDMEQALGPRGLSTPDVIKSALDHKNHETGPKLSSNTIDSLFGVPEKIAIPERYVLEHVRNISYIKK